jgi:FecR protein
MWRYFSRSKHWLLLAIFAFLFLAVSSASRAQAQTDDQDEDQVQAASEQLYPSDGSYDSQARIVRLSYVEGQVKIDTGHGYESATMNVPVVERTWLQTRSDGWAEVQLEDGSLIRLAPDTVISFTRLGRLSSGATVTTIDLSQGEAEFKIAKRDDGEFDVTVKNKTISLDKAGSFRLTSTNADPLELVVFKGSVNVHDSESGGDVEVKKNETFEIDPSDPAQYALDKGTEADQLDQWSRQRDNVLSAYASAGRDYPYQYGAGDLNQYGEYFDEPGYGTVWQPYGVNLGWDPFLNGYWSYCPGFGYTWVSAYPWGWLPYRYGNWVYINGRGWCWVPGGWSRWHTGPRWVNAPPGFRPPVPPANKTIVISGAPGGRVVRPATPGDHGGSPTRSGGSGNSGPVAGRVGNRDGDDRGRYNRRILTNDDVARVPRTDVPAAQPTDADRKPTVVEHQPPANGGTLPNPDAGRFRADPQPMRNPDAGRFNSDAAGTGERRHASYSPPAQPVAPPSQPVRQYTPPPEPAPQPAPVRQYTPPPAAAPAHQSAPASPPQRSFSPPTESHGSEGGHSRPK